MPSSNPGPGSGCTVSWSTPEQAVAVLRDLGDDRILVVDFDETLFLRNSTHEFIRMAKPYLLGVLLYWLLELLRPWRWFAKERDALLTRDWFHVMAVSVFFPWTWLLWRRHAGKMASFWINAPLAKVLAKRNPGSTYLCTNGFGPLVRPILQEAGLAFAGVDACRLLRGYGDRLRPKKERVKRAVGAASLRESAVITDSPWDSSLLEASSLPLLVKWPLAADRSVTSRYIPFYYMVRVKHKGLDHTFRDVVSIDFLLLVLAFSWISPLPVLHIVGLLLFFLSFWLIYEIGYMENDEIAYRHEKDPVNARAFAATTERICYWEPWGWAFLFTLGGAAIFQKVHFLHQLGLSATDLIGDLPLMMDTYKGILFAKSYVAMVLVWFLVLLSMRVVYACYNHADKMTRTWIYPFLQAYKTFGFMAISATNLIGVIALYSQAASRSFAYFLYRWSRREWPGKEQHLVRMIIFFSGVMVLYPAIGISFRELLATQSLAIMLWILLRARKPLLVVLRESRHISRDDWRRAGE